MKVTEKTDRFFRRRASKKLRFAIVVSRFNGTITASLLQGCLDTLHRQGVRRQSVKVQWVPGSFELPLAAQRLARSRQFNAVIALGCVIRGETPHDRYIAHTVAQGLGQAALNTSVPIIFGVLTPLTIAQARARSGKGTRNKGVESALAALEMANFMKFSEGR